MKSISYILITFIGLGVCNAFGKVEYLPLPQNQSVDERTKSNVLSAFGKLPLHFVANQGQLDPSVVYYAKSEGATVYCTEEGLVFGFAEGSISLKFNVIASEAKQSPEARQSRRVKPEARGKLEGKVNYFIGNDPALWRTNIPTFSEVVYRDVYPGIDLVYSGNQQRLKYTFYLQPGSDPNQIQMIYDGIEGVFVDDATGELVIQTGWGEIRDATPVAYQEIEGVRKEVDISFRLMGEKRVFFAVGDYDPNFMLALDPGYSTYLGGSADDYSWSIAVDGDANAYVTGNTQSSNFPTQNAYDDSLTGTSDVFVTKLTASGSLAYSTYLGGSSGECGLGIAVDDSDNIFVTGYTNSTDFPTKNAADDSHNGSEDVFITKLTASGTLAYSTYLGGGTPYSGDPNERGESIAVDGSGSAYVTGYTISTDFPTTQGAHDESHNGNHDAFVTKLTASGALAYSTYVGGSEEDHAYGIAVDSSGNAYITGNTRSTNFPILNPYNDSNNGYHDVFVTKFTASGTLAYSTYLGGNDFDIGYGIAVDSSGDIYVAGMTTSANFPTQNALYDSHNGGEQDGFVTKLTAAGDSLSYSTYLGGSANDNVKGIALDGSGNAYVTGNTYSSNFPTANAYDNSHNGGSDVFVANLTASGSTLAYSTYLGGSSTDTVYDIAVDGSGNAYVTGETRSTDFPTFNAYDDTHNGGGLAYLDAFVASFLSDGSLPVELSLLTATAVSDRVTLRWRTETEVGNVGFRIYRSEEKDGNYTRIAFVSGAGNSAMPNDYQFMDSNVEPGKTYFYYLEDIDIAGERSKSEIIKVVVPPAQPVLPIPKEFRLLQNYPNPFNPSTWLPYELATDATVTIRIYNTEGQLVRQLNIGKQKAGSYITKKRAAYWDGRDSFGDRVASGVYYYTLQAGEFSATQKMVIMK